MEIKFRAWDTEYKVMRSWKEVILDKSYGDDYWLDGYYESRAIISFDHEQILMMYTGLKDENGKEIYLGDICINKNGLEDYYYVVEWIYAGFQLVTYKKPSSDICGISHGINQGYMEDSVGLKVVGDIYRNPELIGDIL